MRAAKKLLPKGVEDQRKEHATQRLEEHRRTHQWIGHRAHAGAGAGNQFRIMQEVKGKNPHAEIGDGVADGRFGSQGRKAWL